MILSVVLVLLAFACSGQVPSYNREVFLTAAPAATNIIDFQDFNLGTGQGTGFLPDFRELGFVVFHTNANYSQEVIDGSNVGQPGNNVYTTVAGNLNGTIADVTFSSGVTAVGFDLKNTGNGSTTGAQTFFATFFSCANNLGTFPIVSPPGGTTFQFFGLTSTNNPITEIMFSSEEATPNLNLVLDNFAVAPLAPLPPMAFQRCAGELVLSWTNCATALQSTPSLTTRYTDVAGASSPFTNATAQPAQFFRLRSN